jgi:2-succinyl-5-enolpyruvyl-6-hydroxy-3-cyclohexene-1-carboxylate synthase
MRSLVEQIPAAYDLQVSNGTAIRYLQLCDYSAIGGSISCNRGVSGIDGCTSTAIGAAMATGRPTLLITGDMSAQYDLGALAIADIPSTFRMAVLNNDGGGIFRFVRSTASLPEREEYFAARVNLPLRQLAEGFGFDYFEATSETELRQAVSEFFDTERQRPAILNIITPAEVSARRLNSYFNQ